MASLICQEKLIEVMEKQPIESGAFWMALSIYPCQNRDEDSINGPEDYSYLKLSVIFHPLRASSLVP
jgi:hypothetical protein